MDLRELLPLYYDFYIVALTKNISQASYQYHVAQPTLSKNVKLLEDILHCPLVHRTNRGIELTVEGDMLYRKLANLFQKFSMEQESVSDFEVTGNLMIGTTRNIADHILNRFLSAFYQKYPHVKINIFTDSASNLNSFLMNHKIDVLIDYLPNINYSEKFELEVKAIGHFNTCFACSKATYEKHGKEIQSIQDLHKCALVIPGSSRRRQMLDRVLQENNLQLFPIVEMPDSKLMADFVLLNDCIGYFIEDEIRDTDLKILPLKESIPQNSYGMIYYKFSFNPVVSKFVQVVLSMCGGK